MKNINLILSVLFWTVASVCMAVTLPTTSYSGSFFDNGVSSEVELGTGVKMTSLSLLKSSSNIDTSVCTTEGVPGDPAACEECCKNKILFVYDDEEAHLKCINSCTQGYSLGESPLGEALLLIPFALVYALVRKRKEETL